MHTLKKGTLSMGIWRFKTLPAGTVTRYYDHKYSKGDKPCCVPGCEQWRAVTSNGYQYNVCPDHRRERQIKKQAQSDYKRKHREAMRRYRNKLREKKE